MAQTRVGHRRIHHGSVRKIRERERTKDDLGRVMARSFPHWMKNMNLQIHEVQWFLGSINLKKSIPTYITSKLVRETENAKNRKQDTITMAHLSAWHNLELAEKSLSEGVSTLGWYVACLWKIHYFIALCSQLWMRLLSQIPTFSNFPTVNPELWAHTITTATEKWNQD